MLCMSATRVDALTHPEVDALKTLYASSRCQGGWDGSTGGDAPCGWNHVNCINAHVTEVHMEGCDADQSGLANISHLMWLHTLGMSGNSVMIFPDLAPLNSTLTAVYLDSNFINGSIPITVTALGNLRILDVSMNSVRGTLPEGMPQSLEKLNLYGNVLESPVPDSLAALPHLQELVLGWNSFSGPFPIPVLNLTSLINLELEVNHFSGTVPAAISALTNLESLFIHQNKFGGQLPDVKQLKHLVRFDGQQNHFTGAYDASAYGRIPKCELKINNFTCPLAPGLRACDATCA